MKKVLFLTKCKFPDGDASSKRYWVFSQYFKDRGYDCVFLGFGDTPYQKEVQIDNSKVISLKRYKKPNLIQKVLNHHRLDSKIIEYALEHHNDVDVVFIDPRFFKKLNHNSKRRNKFQKAMFIYSIVEYYSPCEYRFNGLFSKGFKENIHYNSHILPLDGKIIAISSALEDMYLKRGCEVVRIPFVVNNTNVSIQSKYSENGIVKFIYCGNPRAKDNLPDILRAFLLLDDNLFKRSQVSILGVDQTWLKKQGFKKAEINRLKQIVHFYGRIPFKKVIEFYLNSDFSLLLRPFNERYAKCGFPTKISESLEYGVPPVTNYTSDLGLYLRDGINSFEVKGDDVHSFAKALENCFNLRLQEHQNMKNNAKKTSIEELNILCFYDELDKLTENK